ncbi:hypothetical protein AAC387_Pa09g2014 [Persea americana]
MGKRFKLRISKVFNSFQSCRSKDLPENPHPPIFRVNSKPFDLHFPDPRPPTSLRRQVSSAIASVGCGCRSKTHRYPTLSPPPPPSTDFQWRKDEKWHVVARISNHCRSRKSSDDSSDEIYSEMGTIATRKKKQMNRPRNKKKNRSRIRISTSSASHGGWFSSDGNEDDNEDDERDEYDDTETLVSSSRTFSDDSGHDLFNPTLQTIQEQKPTSKRRTKAATRRRAEAVVGRMGVEGKVKESVAVVKRSEDPYGDFKRSMVEMIVEKEMYGADELEQLLQCFLSLNSRAHHKVIVQAFSEIWNALFCSDQSQNPIVGGGISKAAADLSLL